VLWVVIRVLLPRDPELMGWDRPQRPLVAGHVRVVHGCADPC
jgi:hypothetical protein